MYVNHRWLQSHPSRIRIDGCLLISGSRLGRERDKVKWKAEVEVQVKVGWLLVGRRRRLDLWMMLTRKRCRDRNMKQALQRKGRRRSWRRNGPLLATKLEEWPCSRTDMLRTLAFSVLLSTSLQMACDRKYVLRVSGSIRAQLTRNGSNTSGIRQWFSTNYCSYGKANN